MGEPGELFCIAIIELDLEPCPVEVDDILPWHRGVGREVKPMTAISKDVDYEPDFPLERFAIRNKCICLFIHGIDIDSLHLGFVKIIVINPVSDCAWTTALAGAFAFPLIMKDGVIAKTGYKLVSFGKNFFHEGYLRERRVRNQIARNPLELCLVVGQHLGVPIEERHIIVSAFFVSRLYCAKHHAVMQVGVDNSDSKDLKPVFNRSGTARPEPPYMRSLLPGFGDIRGINGNADAVAPLRLDEGVGTDMEVELHPVQIPLEGLSVALLGLASEPSQLQEIYSSGYHHKKKDYLDYVVSDTFVYICTAGELHHVCDEVAVLVKELGYQHDFEYLGNILKVTDNQRFNQFFYVKLC